MASSTPPQANKADKVDYDGQVLKNIETSTSFDPIGQYFLDPAKHRRRKPNSKSRVPNLPHHNDSSNPDDLEYFDQVELAELSLIDSCLEFLKLKNPYPHLTKSQRERLRVAQLRRKVRSLAHDDWPFWHPSTALFFWISPLAKLGCSDNLTLSDVPQPPRRVTVAKVYPKLISKWAPAIEKEQKRILNWYTARFANKTKLHSVEPGHSSPAPNQNSSIPLKDSYPFYLHNHFQTFDNYKELYEPVQPQLEQKPILIESWCSTHPALTIITHNPDLIVPSDVMDPYQSTQINSHDYNTHNPNFNPSNRSNQQDSIANYPKITTLESGHISRKESFPWMVSVLMTMVLSPVLWTGALELISATSIVMQPLIIKQLAYYLARNENEPTSTWDGLKWALLLSFTGFSGTLVSAVNYQGFLDIIYRQMASVLVSVFDKTFSLAGWSLHDDPHLNIGTVTNMLSQDLSQVAMFPWYLYEGFVGIFLVTFCLVMMYRDLGYAALVAFLLILSMLPWQFYSSSLVSKYRQQLLIQTDNRIRFVTQIFSGIRVIKAYSWEHALGDQIEEFRKKELEIQMKVSALRWLNEIIAFVAPCVITVATIATYIHLTPRAEISPEKCLLIVPYLNTIKSPIQYLSETMTVFVEYHVSTSRIARLFGKEEWPVFERDLKELISIKEQREQDLMNNRKQGANLNDLSSLDVLGSSSPFSSHSHISSNPLAPESTQTNPTQPVPVVQLNNVDFYWASFDKKPFQTPVLSNISLTINPGEIVAVIGPSAIGKTALLTGILGNLYPQPHKTHQGLPTISNVSNLELVPGQFSLRNRIEIIPGDLMYRHNECGYASQHPFLINNTIRNNIILSSDFDQAKFQLCIDAAALGPDLAVLPQGDLTIVSAESGLSGGQQARVAFCRLLYHADFIQVAVLDDIFAAVDSFVAKTMFKKGVRGILKHCGIILALNSHYDFLHEVTRAVYLGPSDDNFWSSLHLQLTNKRNQYEEWAASKRTELGEVVEELIPVDLHTLQNQQQQSTPLQSSDSNGYTQQVDHDDGELDADHDNNSVSKPNSSKSSSDPRSPDPFGPIALSPQTSTTGSKFNRESNEPRDANPNPFQSFRPPSCIQYIGNIEGLFQLDTPLIQAITLAQNKQDEDGQREECDDDNGQHETQKSQLWLKKLKTDEETNTELSLKIGLVTDAKTLKSIDKKLGQKIEGHGEKKNDQTTDPAPTSGGATASQPPPEQDKKSSTSPTQAKLPPDLIFQYFRAHHTKFMGVCIILAVFLVAVGCQVFRNGIDVWILSWAKDVSGAIKHNKPQSHSDSFWIWTSIGALVCNIVLSAALLILFMYIGYSSALYIHNKTISSLFKSTLGYLDTTPMGTIINALTRDIYTVDATVPNYMISLSQQLLSMAAILILTIWASPLLLLPLFPVLIFIYWARAEYHNTAVQLRRIENASAQPVYSTFHSLIKGSAVLRSFGSRIGVAYIEKFRSLADDYIRAGFICSLISGRFSFNLNMIAALYTTLLSIGIVLLRDRVSATMALLSISYSLTFTSSLHMTIRSVTAAAQALTGVHRLKLLETTVPHEPTFTSDSIARQYVRNLQPTEFKDYQNLQTQKHNIANDNGKPRYVLMEDQKTVIDLHFKYNEQQKLSYWPWFGKIVFEDVTLRYRPELPIVLNKCSFTIQPGQHCGLVAPTGAGKSTTLLALMRMINLDSGRILIDGVDITQIGLGDLRSRLGLIPQQSIIFSGTVRSNLDPLSRFTDDELWLALSLVAMVPKIEQMGGLYSEVLENGSNFSSSERQLLCIGRSLLSQPTLETVSPKTNQRGNNRLPASPPSKTSPVFNTTTSPINHTDDSSAYPDPFSIHLDNAAQNNLFTPSINDPSLTNLEKLQQGSILLADEITSMVSGENDALVQSTIRSAFARSTILVIAHRLASVVDLDRIIVLRRITQSAIEEGLGSVLEFEVPWILLNDPDSQFYQMCMATGADNFVLLWCKARNAFFRTQKKEKDMYNHTIVPPIVDYDNLPPELVAFLKQEAKSPSTTTSPISSSPVF